MAEPLTTRLAERISERYAAPLSGSDRALIKRALLDTVGVGIAGWRLPSSRILWSSLKLETSPGPARVLGIPARVVPAASALINGLLCHAQLYDDNNGPMIAHPSAPIVAALLALGPQAAVSGTELIRAYAVGFETSVSMGRLCNPQHYERGWHATATLGIFGATATAAVLLGCSHDQTATALAIAASLASGVRQNFGSMTMGLHAGWTSHGAVTAALLAKDGFSASRYAIDGKYGFLDAFGTQANVDAYLPGEASELSRSGIQFKLYPSGAPTLCAVEAALEIAPQLGGRIRSAKCVVGSWSEKTLKDDPPDDPFAAKVNLRYCVAAALLRRRLTLREFEPDALQDSDIRGLMPRIAVEVDPALDDPVNFPARVEVLANDGAVVATRLVARGSAGVPPTDADLVQKFIDCVSDCLGREDADGRAHRILALDALAPESVFDALVVCESALGRT